jgi:hypothetical protein
MSTLFAGIIAVLALFIAGFFLPVLWIAAAVALVLVFAWAWGERRRSTLSTTGNPTNTGESAGSSAPPREVPAADAVQR